MGHAGRRRADEPDVETAASTESQRWREQVELLGYRIAEIEKVLPELLKLAEMPVATDDDIHAHRSAQASLRLAKAQRADLQGDYWISVLERAGVFPNYTLLDDSVTLDVGLSWLDPDSGTYETQTYAYQRNAALALREFAPGATFYAGGYQVRINAIDLGNKGEAVRSWAFCAACGYQLRRHGERAADVVSALRKPGDR